MKFLSVILCFVPSIIFGQNEWSLQRCFDSAMVNNPTVHLSKLDYNQAMIQKKNAIYSFLPSINGGATHGYNWGQTLDPFTNQFATNRVQYDNFYMNSSVILFAGLQNYYAKKILEINLDYESLNRILIERTIKMEIARNFLQAQLDQEMVGIAIEELQTTEQLQFREQSFFEEQQKTKSDLLKINAQRAQDKHKLLKAQNDLNYTFLVLQQLIGLPQDSAFSISKNPILIELVPSGTENLLELQLGELNIEKQELSNRQTKGQLYPKLVLNGSLGTGYSGNNKILSPSGNFSPKPLSDQLNENFYKSTSISLSIPVFNNFKTKTQIEINELKSERIRQEFEITKQETENTINRIKLDIVNDNSLLNSLETVHESAKLEYENSLLQFQEGKIDYTSHIQSKETLYKAKSDIIQVRHKIQISTLILYLLLQ